MGRRFCPGVAIVQALRAACAKLGMSARFRTRGGYLQGTRIESTVCAAAAAARMPRAIQLCLALAGVAMLTGPFPAAAGTPDDKLSLIHI